ncbi:hypothetical protein PFICI_06508 [Pestalotiopsis fici W106-1]|uniref:AAA+ ATPase domain-containing protein n=1 Tax=Pestalotiopsis fici (strain W106-1 / CGMCC3.15140) TaxID=1229662 RepID=W3X8J2_PESFW|nr:uncharacterized protein PFICI_06508 [Pestalotiopsis fici W106-1]ETS81506.1 hypothetical protein PFICI_06508 [Pestalotiopsis fici W106-1]
MQPIPHENLLACTMVPPPPPPPRMISEASSDSWSSDSDHEEKGKSQEAIQIGMTTETKDLYREDPRTAWEEWAPEDIGINSKSTPASAKFALIVRREKENGDTEEPVLALHSITVQSPLLKKQLGPVFDGYHGINTNLKKLEFRAPFREFFYRWDKFILAAPDQEEEVAAKHYKLLFNVISNEIQPHIDHAADLLKNGVISFDYVWTLFEPGSEIYAKVDDQDRLFVLNSGNYVKFPDGQQIYSLSCRYIDTNGKSFGYATTTLTISEFHNVKPICDLAILPSHLQADIAGIRSRLESRGRKFESLIGMNYKAYSGGYNLRKPPLGASRRQFVDDGRVMIDCSSFDRYDSHGPITLAPLDDAPSTKHTDLSQALPLLDESDSEDDKMPPIAHLMRGMIIKNRKRLAASNKENLAYFYVDQIRDIIWNQGAFDQLVLPHDYKQIIHAFVDAQLSHVDDFDDVIKGKGKGIIMLLSGEPGTGKTLTSESVAEAMEKPLYSMSAGELGDDADVVEQNLHRVLELAAKWGAVLLIDECDVFLEQRTTSDLHRNKLVSVFLRLLEYYQGVMFLTTNRVAAFDPAFESRIHLTIHYPQLDRSSRLHIWRTFVHPDSAGKTSAVQEADLSELAENELNGRQIKNVVKTARLLASKAKAPLSMDHISMVLRVKRGGPAGFQTDLTNRVSKDANGS